MELQNQLLITRDLGYIKKGKFAKITKQTIKLSKLINGLIKTSQDHSL